jgi:hypothetical protein
MQGDRQAVGLCRNPGLAPEGLRGRRPLQEGDAAAGGATDAPAPPDRYRYRDPAAAGGRLNRAIRATPLRQNLGATQSPAFTKCEASRLTAISQVGFAIPTECACVRSPPRPSFALRRALARVDRGPEKRGKRVPLQPRIRAPVGSDGSARATAARPSPQSRARITARRKLTCICRVGAAAPAPGLRTPQLRSLGRGDRNVASDCLRVGERREAVA